MARGWHMLRIARAGVALSLAVAALLCLAGWATTVMYPQWSFAWVSREISAGRYSARCSLLGSGLMLNINIRKCWLCGRYGPEHEPDCLEAGGAPFSIPRLVTGDHSIHIPGLYFSDRCVLPPVGVIGWSLYISLWLLAALLGAYPAFFLFAWARRRRRRFRSQNACRGCGYDLTGNVSGVCPECGSAVSNAISTGDQPSARSAQPDVPRGAGA